MCDLTGVKKMNATQKRINELEAQVAKLQEEKKLLHAVIDQNSEGNLRDRFAIAALTGYISATSEFYVDEIAISCYIVADAMMEERTKVYNAESA